MTTYYLAFNGQNATTGTPNRLTGLSSMYGDIIAFTSKDNRDRYVAEYYDNNPSVFVVAVNRKQARGYNLGMSMYDYNEYIRFVESNADEDYHDLVGRDENGQAAA